MNTDIIITVVVAFIGAGLFLAVEKYERNRLLADFLKFLVLGAGSAAILHKLQPVARFSTQVCASLHRSVLVGRAGVVLPGGSARQQAERLLPVASIPPRFVRADAQH